MTSLTDDHLVATAAILYYVRTSDTVKLRWGLQVRRDLGVRLARGEKPNNYRIDWLFKAKNAIVDALMAESKKFNETFPHDRISTLDQLDALETVAEAIRRVSKKVTNSG